MCVACSKELEPKLFQKIEASNSGVNFINQITNTENFNIFNYRNFYNGGGVGLGDVNNDGLVDVYFTANQGSNKLYLNRGSFIFEDATVKAGVAVLNKWSTGVSMVDINADGWLDIYVCNAGYQKGIDQKNNLFINNKDGTFTNQAEVYNLNHNGYSTHAAFFDYDKDGDLDAYILNNSFIPVNTLNYANKRNLKANDWPVEDFLKGGGDVLMRNDNGSFVDVTDEAGIYSSLIGFGLGVTVGDVNNDDWDDLYICNDFFERDYLYINQQNGTFKEELEQRINHISLSSMGADMADLNNDGSPEIFVTDMLPNEEYRLKTTSSYENIDVFNLKKERGFYYQFMQNTLQLNNGAGQFKEIANKAGVQASDWSWGALLFDADNDALTDIFICNGIYNDVIDQDFIDFFANDIIQKMVLSGTKEKIDSIINKLPSVPICNKMFKNLDSMCFEDVGLDWGLDDQTFSNGAAYADLDNDGDLDLVINNINQPALIYKNNAINNYFQIKLKYKAPNINAIGAKVQLFLDGTITPAQKINPYKGFQSCVETKLTFGLRNFTTLHIVKIYWPNGKIQILKRPAINELIEISYNENDMEEPMQTTKKTNPEFEKIENTPFEKHDENEHIDFYYERNILELLSKEGPAYAKADVNADGMDDIFIGGAANQASQLYLNTNKGFVKKEQNILQKLKAFEATAAAFFDADNDGDQDLLIGNGGNQLPAENRGYQDQLLLNDGSGNFELAFGNLPKYANNTSVIAPHDFDNDGDTDVFIGSRNYPQEYGVPPFSFLLVNDGSGRFSYYAKQKTTLPNFSTVGMVTDATWANVYGNKNKELIIVGDWMAPNIFTVTDTAFVALETNLKNKFGFWRAAVSADFNKDGFDDLILGNIGNNFSLPFDSVNPLKLFINDFDGNRFVDKVLTKTVNGQTVPVMLKREMADQFAFIKKKNLKHSEYARQNIYTLFEKKKLESAITKQVNYPYSIVVYGNAYGNFTIEKLSDNAQLSCINNFCILPNKTESYNTIYAGGNNFNYLPQFSRLDACPLLEIGKIQNWFAADLPNIRLTGQLRHIDVVHINKKPHLLIIENDEVPLLYEVK